jgi:hypothetical protein
MNRSETRLTPFGWTQLDVINLSDVSIEGYIDVHRIYDDNELGDGIVISPFFG